MTANLPLPFDPEIQSHQADRKASRAASHSRTGPRTAVGAPGFLSVRRAADALELRPRSVIDLIQRGLLDSQRLGRAHFIAIGEVERYRRVRRERQARRRSRQDVQPECVPIDFAQQPFA